MTEMTETDSTDVAPRWRIEVSRACISSGICLAGASDHFEFVGVRAKATTEQITSADEAELVMDVADACPVGAITVIEV
jgi:ferredoxin